MELDKLKAQLEITANLVEGLVAAQPDDLGLLGSVAALQAALEERAPEHA